MPLKVHFCVFGCVVMHYVIAPDHPNTGHIFYSALKSQSTKFQFFMLRIFAIGDNIYEMSSVEQFICLGLL